jgi:hypothetical protein
MEFKRLYWCRAPDCVDNVARNNSEEEALAFVEEECKGGLEKKRARDYPALAMGERDIN